VGWKSLKLPCKPRGEAQSFMRQAPPGDLKVVQSVLNVGFSQKCSVFAASAVSSPFLSACGYG